MNVELLELSSKNGSKFFTHDGALYSMTPPETMFGYTFHAYAIPPFCPSSILILGYGMGTCAHLMRKIWGLGLKITGVDKVSYPIDFVEFKHKVCDAYDFVRGCTSGMLKTRYDYILIDLYEGKEICDFVFFQDFAQRIKEMTKRLLCINVPEPEMSKAVIYCDVGFCWDRAAMIDSQAVMYWSIKNEKEKTKNS